MRLIIMTICCCLNSLCSWCQDLQASDPPTVLHDSITFQWGGHTFAYLLEGEQAVFWAARLYDGGETKTLLVGQIPKPGSELSPATTTIPFEGPDTERVNPPQILRSSDGYIHIFTGSYDVANHPWGRIGYYRSAVPEDISTLLDRSSLITDTQYESYHLRQNVAISQDGNRMVLVTLTGNRDGSMGVPFNIPIIFFAEKVGADFVFQEPIAYAEQMGFFYPLIAITDHGIVIAGEIWDAQPEKIFGRLIHLDWNGVELNRIDLPVPSDGVNLFHDMRPAFPNNWDKLILSNAEFANDYSSGAQRLYVYDTRTMELSLLTTIDSTYNSSNSGSWIYLNSQSSVFVNNPVSSGTVAWEGNLLENGAIISYAVPGANPLDIGYPYVNYVSVPSPFYGSVPSPNGFYLGVDAYTAVPPDAEEANFLLYRIESDLIDQDGDDISDSDELMLGTDWKNIDSDFDGFSDGLEVEAGTNPLNSGDFSPFSPVWVDFDFIGVEKGTLTAPDNTLDEAVTHVTSGGVVYLKPGVSEESTPLTIGSDGRSMSIQLQVGESGTASIGSP